MASVWLNKLKLPICLILLQAIFVVLFCILVEYGPGASPKPLANTNSSGEGQKKEEEEEEEEEGEVREGKNVLHDFYPMFQDVHVMIFIGFGFLMMFLRRYGFSSVGLNMLISVIAIQWATLVGGLIHHHGKPFEIGIQNMLTADFACAAVLITFGALLGKTSPMQMVVVTMLEITLFAVNEYIGVVVLEVVDIGGSMFVHAFGAYFGLAMSRVLYRQEIARSQKENSVYHSDMFAVVGSVFLWMFWPSFNSALAQGDAQHRAVLNTYLTLASCCLVTFAVSSVVDKQGKFDMVHIQNATLAGGVAVGTSADMMIQPYGALVIGFLAGLLSVIGYKLKIHDTCGVNNLHGMPAIMAGITGAIVVSMADVDTYGETLYRQFPAMAPSHSEGEEIQGRSAGKQATYQVLALVITLFIAIVGGLLTGLLLKVSTCLGQPSGERLFEDSPTWHVPEEPMESLDPIVARVLEELEKRRGQTSKFSDDSGDPLLGAGDIRKGDITLVEKSAGVNGEQNV